MENTMTAGVTYTYNQKELVEKVNKTINLIKEWIEKNNYQVTGNIDNYLDIPMSNLSKNQMKKIQKYCYWFYKKPSLKRVNIFFSLLSKTFGIERVKVRISLKEEQIQKSRKEWIKARNEADRLLKAYKDEKGDFYKNKI